MTAEGKVYRTKAGREVTDAEIEAIADEVERGDYELDHLRSRRGRPRIGKAPAEVVPVRLDPDLRGAVGHEWRNASAVGTGTGGVGLVVDDGEWRSGAVLGALEDEEVAGARLAPDAFPAAG